MAVGEAGLFLLGEFFAPTFDSLGEAILQHRVYSLIQACDPSIQIAIVLEIQVINLERSAQVQLPGKCCAAVLTVFCACANSPANASEENSHTPSSSTTRVMSSEISIKAVALF